MEKEQNPSVNQGLDAQQPGVNDIDAKLKQAITSHQHGAFEAAETSYLAVLTWQPAHFEALQMYAALQAQLGKPSKALELIDRALAQGGSNAVAHFYRGNILRDLNRAEDALASYQLALQINPDFPAALYGCGNAWQDLNRPEDALASYDQALRLNSDLVEVLYNRGKMLQELKQPAEALASYERALQINPGLAEAHCSRGDALMELRRPAQALGSYERALEINPELGVALYHRGDTLRELGRVGDALASYERALQLYPDFVEAVIKHADALKELKQYDKAVQEYDRAITLNPASAEAYNNRGAALFDLARYEEALADYEKAIALNPYFDLPYVNRGNILKILARPDEGGKDVVWLPTSQALVDKMLDMVALTAEDFLIDLGSGDGRTVITAAKRGANALGIEYNPGLVAQSQRNALEAGVGNKASFMKLDVFEADFSRATVLTMFLLPDMMLRLRSKILDLEPGTRVVSNTYTIRDWTADETATVEENLGSNIFFTAHLWIVPARIEGTWQFAGGELLLRQHYQMLDGHLKLASGLRLPITVAKLRGNQLTFRANDTDYAGLVNGDVISGTACNRGVTIPWSASLSNLYPADKT